MKIKQNVCEWKHCGHGVSEDCKGEIHKWSEYPEKCPHCGKHVVTDSIGMGWYSDVDMCFENECGYNGKSEWKFCPCCGRPIYRGQTVEHIVGGLKF